MRRRPMVGLHGDCETICGVQRNASLRSDDFCIRSTQSYPATKDLEATVTMLKAKPQHGFSLIDVLIAVAIVGILAAIAFPSYQSAMRKSNRAAAESYLADVAQRQQQYLLDQRSYASSVSTLGVAAPASVTPFYTIAIAVTAGPPPGFTASATPTGSQALDLSGQPLTITNTGAKGPSGAW